MSEISVTHQNVVKISLFKYNLFHSYMNDTFYMYKKNNIHSITKKMSFLQTILLVPRNKYNTISQKSSQRTELV